jgi:hypothetical protein
MRKLITESYEEFLAEGSLSSTEKERVMNFVKDKKGKSISDAEMHAFAEEIKADIHDVESYVYGFASKHLAESSETVGAMHKLMHGAGQKMPKNHEEHATKFKEIMKKDGKDAAAKWIASVMKGCDEDELKKVI